MALVDGLLEIETSRGTRFGRAPRTLGAALTLALALGLFLSALGGARPIEALDCHAAPAGVQTQVAAPCQVTTFRGPTLHAETGAVWVALDPVEVLIFGSTEGKAIYRGLLANGADLAENASSDVDGEKKAEAEPRAGGLDLARYTVQAGDTLSSVAERFKIDVPTILQANNLAKEPTLAVGSRLLVPPAVGVVHRVQAGDTLSALVERYSADLEKVARFNGLLAPYTLTVGQALVLPGGKLPPEPVVEAPKPGPRKSEPPAEAQPPRDAETPKPTQVLAASIELPPILPRPPGANPQRAAFILGAAEAARESQHETGVPASVAIAQAILESDWGLSRLSKEYHNYFGIKAKDKPGTAGVVWFETWEVINGVSVVLREPFRAYHRAADSFVDHGRFFIENRRYAAALAAKHDPHQFAREINKAGYATDPDYAPKLIALMDRYDLYAYDLK